MRRIDTITVHCSASDLKSHDNISTIRKWHMKENGWSDIGYNAVILKDGIPRNCRPIEKIPSGVKGKNTGTLAVCVTGLNKYAKSQFEGLNLLMIYWCGVFTISPERVLPHNFLDNNKDCPVFGQHQIKKALGYLPSWAAHGAWKKGV